MTEYVHYIVRNMLMNDNHTFKFIYTNIARHTLKNEREKMIRTNIEYWVYSILCRYHNILIRP